MSGENGLGDSAKDVANVLNFVQTNSHVSRGKIICKSRIYEYFSHFFDGFFLFIVNEVWV